MLAPLSPTSKTKRSPKKVTPPPAVHPAANMTKRALFLLECLHLQNWSGVDDAVWEPFQVAHLCDDGMYRIEDKSRQIAFSALCAAESVAEAILDGGSTAFVSINQDEASEKIRYAKLALENLILTSDWKQMGVRIPKLKRDNQLLLEFANGARITSLPARPPRGKARFHIVLDEFCHIKGDRDIYSAAQGFIAKGKNLRLRIGSSLMGESGQHWEISQQKIRRYTGFNRSRTPWWRTYAFCIDPEQFERAEKMTTSERVEVFGKSAIQNIYNNMPEDDFQREFEATYTDESVAWITWDEIKNNQNPDLLSQFVTVNGKNGQRIDIALRAIDQVLDWVRAGKIEAVLAAGVDVGRTKNTTEIYVVGLATTEQYPLRLAITLDVIDYDDQLEVIAYLLKKLPIMKLLIDRNGIGHNLAENLAKLFPGKAEGALFDNANKTLWATDAKMLAQQRRVPMPVNRDLGYQIHSIKRTISASKNMIFDSDKNEKHHADKFWAWALAIFAANQKPKRPGAMAVQRKR